MIFADDIADYIGQPLSVTIRVVEGEPVTYTLRLRQVHWWRLGLLLEFDSGEGSLPWPIDWKWIESIEKLKARIAE